MWRYVGGGGKYRNPTNSRNMGLAEETNHKRNTTNRKKKQHGRSAETTKGPRNPIKTKGLCDSSGEVFADTPNELRIPTEYLENGFFTSPRTEYQMITPEEIWLTREEKEKPNTRPKHTENGKSQDELHIIRREMDMGAK